MKNNLKNVLHILFISSILFSNASNASNTDTFSYSYLEATSVKSKVDKLNDEELSGFKLQGSIALNDNAYLKLQYLKSEDEVNFSGSKKSIEYKDYYFGAGYHSEVNQTTDWFIELAGEKLSGQFVKGLDNDDDAVFSYSASLGLKKKLLTDLELEAAVKHLYNQNGSEFSVKLDAYYNLIDHLSIGVNYEVGAELETLGASVRYEF